MDENIFEAQVQLDSFTIVTLKDGRTTYIKEFFTQEEVTGKEELEVTKVYLVMPPHLDLRNMAAFEDENSYDPPRLANSGYSLSLQL